MKAISTHSRKGAHGFALLLALGILVIVSSLGTAYVTYMTIESEEVQVALWKRHADALAERAVTLARVDIARSLTDGPVPESLTYDQLVLFQVAPDEERPLAIDERYNGTAAVQIIDENAKLNLNYASVRLLQTILGVDGATAREIRASLPRPGESPTEDRRWFLHVDELVTRGFLTRDQFSEVPKNLLTVYSSPSPDRPIRYINVNTAPPAILAAIFAVDIDTAKALAEARPFDTPDALYAALEADPAQFNVASPEAAGELPPALALTSTTFRLRCEAGLERLTGPEAEVVGRKHVEAIVQFAHGDGAGQIISWRGVRGEDEPAS